MSEIKGNKPPPELLRSEKLKPSARRILVVLWSHAHYGTRIDELPFVFASSETIANEAGLHEGGSQVRSGLRELRKHGAVIETNEGGRYGWQLQRSLRDVPLSDEELKSSRERRGRPARKGAWTQAPFDESGKVPEGADPAWTQAATRLDSGAKPAWTQAQNAQGIPQESPLNAQRSPKVPDALRAGTGELQKRANAVAIRKKDHVPDPDSEIDMLNEVIEELEDKLEDKRGEIFALKDRYECALAAQYSRLASEHAEAIAKAKSEWMRLASELDEPRRKIILEKNTRIAELEQELEAERNWIPPTITIDGLSLEENRMRHALKLVPKPFEQLTVEEQVEELRKTPEGRARLTECIKAADEYDALQLRIIEIEAARAETIAALEALQVPQ